MQKLIVIPARLGSTRLKKKMLLKKTGKFLIQHSWENAKRAKADEVWVATDSEEVLKACQSFGAKCMLTGNAANGTIRTAIVAAELCPIFVVNLQGDWPDIPPETVDAMFEYLEENKNHVSSAYYKIAKPQDNDKVKVVMDNENFAMYFSRCPIPHGAFDFNIHVGAYGYRLDVLKKISGLKDTHDGLYENLEQLKIIQNGFKIKMIECTKQCLSVDRKKDYGKFSSMVQETKS